MYRMLLCVVAIQFVLANSYVIEVLEPRNSTNESRSLLKMAMDERNAELRTSGAAFTLRLSNVSSVRNDTHEKVSGDSLLKSNVIGMLSLDTDLVEECILSSISGIPLFSLNDQETTRVKHFGFCDKLVTMSANYFTYAEATDGILSSFQWKKIALIFEGYRFYQTVFFQSLAIDKDYQITYIQMEKEANRTALAMANKVMNTLAASDVDVILLYVRDSYKSVLLSMEACNPKKSYVWIIQGSISDSMKSHPDHMTVGFHLPREQSLLNGTLIEDSINLIFDTTSVVSMAMDKLLGSGRWSPDNSTSSLIWNRKMLYEQAIKTTITGKTGLVKFNKKGERRVEVLSVVNLRNNVFVKIGTWSKNSTTIRLDGEIKQNIEQKNRASTLQGRKLSVTTMTVDPFVFKTKLPDGTIKYTGFCIDLLQKLAADLKFTYDIHEPPDLQYGSLHNGSWNGIIREIIDGEADMGVADITITKERETVVDFTVGFMYYREDMVMQKRPIEYLDFLQFMDPFSVGVWTMLLISFLISSLALFVINYFSPYGHKDEQGNKTSEEFQFFNCFWFSAACMLQQGADHLPKAVSGRVLVGFFWFSILIWVSTYTANLAAFFTVSDLLLPITSFEEAVYSSEYKMGLSKKSHLYGFFANSQVELYQRAWRKMKEFEVPKDNKDGIQRARKGHYIHIANRPVLDYEIGKPPCDLIIIPGLETPKSYGFALKTDDPHLQQISLGILRLRGNGVIEALKRKYWSNNGECNPNDNKKITRSTIQLSSMAGVFLVLAVGCLTSVFTLVLEIFWYHYGPRVRQKVETSKGKISLGFTRKVFITRRNNDLQMGRVNEAVEAEDEKSSK